MKTFNVLYILMPLIISGTAGQTQSPQSLKSILINLGESSYGNRSPEQQLFTNALTNPALLQACNPGLPFFYASIAYNPKYRKVYFADFHDAASTSVYLLDYNFSGAISCPASVLLMWMVTLSCRATMVAAVFIIPGISIVTV